VNNAESAIAALKKGKRQDSQLFETNVFGVASTIRAAAGMRAHKMDDHQHLVSERMSPWLPRLLSASKHSVEACTDALRKSPPLDQGDNVEPAGSHRYSHT